MPKNHTYPMLEEFYNIFGKYLKGKEPEFFINQINDSRRKREMKEFVYPIE